MNGVHYYRGERERERPNLPDENGNGTKKLDEQSNERVVRFCSTDAIVNYICLLTYVVLVHFKMF